MKLFPRLSFLSVKGVPTLSWSSPKPLNLRPDLVTVILLVVGLTIFGLGEALLIAAGTGVSPWTVLAQGVSQQAGWSIGLSTFLVSITVLILWWPLKQVPGIGTILNAIIIALVLEFALPYLPTPDAYISQVLLTLLGILVTGLGSGIYLIANLGPGPRDGLMTGLQQQTNFPIAWIRSGIELSAVIIGWSLGGVVGLGTVLFAVLIGPSVALSLFVLDKFFGNEKK
ncbi:membrane protein [Kiloniella litopenaei]|uniref:Membrane protein n=1 Tax=Kiloniella litopenaei TaxID=1549748 RepID=A0A0M2REJ4_9PROT|nr:membrane protein [Kiloniella litopenaei]KKJ77993.1 membrane protein [Kiloniella litopenaei]